MKPTTSLDSITTNSTPNHPNNSPNNDSVEDLITLLLQPPRMSTAATSTTTGDRNRQEPHPDRAVLGSAQIYESYGNTCNGRETSRQSHNSLLSILDEALLVLDRHHEERQEQSEQSEQ